MRLRRSQGIRSLFGAQVWMAMKSVRMPIQLYAKQLSHCEQQLLSLRPHKGASVCPEEYPQVFLTPVLKLHQTCEAVRVFRTCAERLISSNAEHDRAKKLIQCIIRTVGNLDSALQAWAHEGSEAMQTARWHRYRSTTLTRSRHCYQRGIIQPH